MRAKVKDSTESSNTCEGSRPWLGVLGRPEELPSKLSQWRSKEGRDLSDSNPHHLILGRLMRFHCSVHTIFPSDFTAAIGSGSRQRLCGIGNFSCNPRICGTFRRRHNTSN